MCKQISLAKIYRPSDQIVARTVEGQVIIVPLTAGIADDDETIFTLNMTGQAVWQFLDGQRTLQEVITALSEEFAAEQEVIETDVQGLVTELCSRGMLVEQ